MKFQERTSFFETGSPYFWK